MLTTLLIATAAILTTPTDVPLRLLARHVGAAPYVELWTDRDEVYRRGDRMRVYFETDVDAYVTIFRVDTDGRVRVLFPIDPWDDNYARGAQRYEISSRQGGYAFRIDDYPGQGFLFAVASADPFAYAPYVRGNHWDYRAIADQGRVVGDPYVALGALLDVIVPPNYVAYSYDVASYHVERMYDYPRFLCYDCHTYAAWPYWNPYHNPCFRFRIVIYDDPYYYPARVNAGTRVVYRPRTIVAPRYVFETRDPDREYVQRVRERPVDDDGRRRISEGATRRTIADGRRVPIPMLPDALRPTDRTRRSPLTPDDERSPTTSGRLERRDPNRAGATVDPRRVPVRRDPPTRAGPRSTPGRRTSPARPTPPRTEPTRAPTRRTEPQRSGTRRNQPPKRRGNN